VAVRTEARRQQEAKRLAPLLRAALGCAQRGRPVFPLHSIRNGRCSCDKVDCESPAKHPRTRNGLKNATTDAKQIRRWWAQWPAANIGLVTGSASGLVVIDVDIHKGGDAGLHALEQRFGALPETLTARTGSGGKHLFFCHPGNGAIIKNAVGFLGASGVDIRADGGYVVAPPSRNIAGPYAWATRLKPAALPKNWLAALIQPPTPEDRTRRSTNDAAPGHSIPKGERNARLASIAGSLRRRGATESTIAAALHAANADQCDPPLPRDEVEAIARSIARYDHGAGTEDAHPSDLGDDGPDERIEIVLGADEIRVNDVALAALAAEPSIYARGNRLVRVVRPRDGGAPVIQELPASSLRELLTRRVRFMREVKDALVPAHPPEWCVAALVARAELHDLRHLAGVAVSPAMRPDGSILDRRGYDPATGLFLEPAGEVSPVPEHPSRADAQAAAEALLEVVGDFPFAQPAHCSAWMAGVLTPYARHAIRGNVPAVVVDANTRGSGKGLLVDTIAIITTGRPISRSPQPREDDEMRKHITAAAIGGTPAILIDNITGKFSYRSFDAAITCNGTWSDRVLGRSERRVLPLHAVWFITSNNAAFSSDTARRVLPIRLMTEVEHPEDRRDFRHPDLLAWVSAERPRLACAALTILRAYHAADRPQTDLLPWGSFENWSALIRQCIVWLGLTDPVAARAELRERADADRDAILSLLTEMEQLAGADISAAELLERSASHPDLRAALDELCPPRPGEDRPSTQRIGALLRSLRDRVVDGRRLEGRPGHGRALRWRVSKCPDSGTGKNTHHPHHPHPGNGECGEYGEDDTRPGGAASEVVE